MKRAFLAMTLLIAMCSFLLSCGGGSMGLTVLPGSSNIFTDLTHGTYLSALLTATRSDGSAPTGLQWKSDNACVLVGNNIQNTTTAICNFTCRAGTIKATITATAKGRTGESVVVCTWR